MHRAEEAATSDGVDHRAGTNETWPEPAERFAEPKEAFGMNPRLRPCRSPVDHDRGLHLDELNFVVIGDPSAQSSSLQAGTST